MDSNNSVVKRLWCIRLVVEENGLSKCGMLNLVVVWHLPPIREVLQIVKKIRQSIAKQLS